MHAEASEYVLISGLPREHHVSHATTYNRLRCARANVEGGSTEAAAILRTHIELRTSSTVITGAIWYVEAH